MRAELKKNEYTPTIIHWAEHGKKSLAGDFNPLPEFDELGLENKDGKQDIDIYIYIDIDRSQTCLL